MADTSAGFRFRYRMSGGQPTIQYLTIKDNETLTKGDMANLEAGEIDLAATGDANLIGMVQESKVGVDSVTRFGVITDPDAVYAVYDPNTRKIGDTLDITGATGAQTIAASSNKEFVVVADSAANEETLVTVNRDAHAFAKAQ